MLISFQDVTLQTGGSTSFEHTDWQIRPNEHWAILGPTGAGKSLLAQALCRRVPLLHGQILYFFDKTEPQGRPYLLPGEILTLSAETHRDFLTHYAAYHQARWQSSEGEEIPTVRELLFGEGQTLARDEQGPTDWVSKLHLDYLLDRRLLHLSHGESRKVHLARLLLRSPRVLILDDPTAGLDAESRELLAHTLDVLLRQGSPQILLVTSRLEDIPAGIDRILLVADRKISAQGKRETILAGEISLPLMKRKAGFVRGTVFELVVRQYSDKLEMEGQVSESLVEMQDVSVRYGEVDVLSGIDWRVRRGERWALSGHNGAGKTTLLSLILADNPQAYANEIRLFGIKRGSGESIWDIKKNIGWVSPELHAYYPRSATCQEVVGSGFFDSVGLYQRCSQEQAGVAQVWLEAFGIQSLAEQSFQSLSTGEQRLVLLARALVKNPPLLVLDEPCQGLDDEHRAYFVDLLNHLCAHTPLAVIYVTHHQEEIPAVVTHLLRLEHGKIIQKDGVSPHLSG